MISIDMPIIVEGKYDKIKLSSLVDGLIIKTDGFEIFKDKKRRKMISDFANSVGIIVLTDSDSAGKIIRNHIKSISKDGKVYNAYIPKILGKEKRKRQYSKEKILGVEGMEDKILLEAIKKSGAIVGEKKSDTYTKLDLYNLGLSGRQNSKRYRKKLLLRLNLPDNLSSNELISYLNITTKKEDLFKIMEDINEGRN